MSTKIKLGIGLYKNLLTPQNFAFARQCGATHIIIHLVDYFGSRNPALSAFAGNMDWGPTSTNDSLWTLDSLKDIQRNAGNFGLEVAGIENFDPGHWHDILLDGPDKYVQIEHLKQIIRTVGAAGIPVFGYNFSIAGVWGWNSGPYGRGGAKSIRFDSDRIDIDTPIHKGVVWNMQYTNTVEAGCYIDPVSEQELWDRYRWFIEEIIPVAEQAGVRMALHPDDPPMEQLRRTARLVNRPEKYKQIMDMVKSPAHSIEFCAGSIQEMPGGDLYETIDYHSRRNEIAYTHLRNVTGKVPHYQEVFIDEGDIDIKRVLSILDKNGYDGVVVPDHTPELSCDAPWHSGMAYAMGYIKALLQEL